MKPLWLISYDIACPKRLKRVHKLCGQEGWVLQKSVFVVALDKAERVLFCNELMAQIDKSEDRLLCLPFVTGEGSFHEGNKDTWLIMHSDERLEGYVF